MEMEITPYQPPEENAGRNNGFPEDSEVAVNENVSTVPDQFFSFDYTWRSTTSRKQVACLIVKVVFPELQPDGSYFRDSRVDRVFEACQRAEIEAFDYSKSHRDYETRVKDIIGRMLKQKHSHVDINRALETLKNNRGLPIMHRNRNIFLHRQLALNASVPGGNRRNGVLSICAAPNMTPTRFGNHEGLRDGFHGPLMSSTPVQAILGKRYFDPRDTEQQKSIRLLDGPMNKVPRLTAKADNDEVQSEDGNFGLARIQIKREIKVERLSPPCSPINGSTSQSICSPPGTADRFLQNSIRKQVKQVVPYHRRPKTWQNLFTPILNRIIGLTEAKTFKLRHERDRQNVIRYYKDGEPVVTRPLDLLGIQTLMKDEKYMTNPWNFISDMCWVFTLPLCTTRKNLKRQKGAKNLLKNFVEHTNKIMMSFKYCCGRQYFYFPYDLVCVGREGDVCCIPPYTKYFMVDNTWAVCEKCFNHKKDLTIKIRDRRTNEERVILKSEFVEFKNDKVIIEPMVLCVNCCREYHKVCVQYLELNGNNVYTCDSCLASRGEARQVKLRACHLPTCTLDKVIEERVEKYLSKNGVDRKVWIRVVSCIEKTTEIKKEMKELYVDEDGDGQHRLSESYPYRQKVVFAFEEIDGRDVAFFAMYVQEYGSECPAPNTRRAYISYLDSVHYFQPKEHRTGVYHEILLAYLKHIRALGFKSFHIWACPPNEGNDYIFYAHPPEQKVPKANRLLDWYRRMLDKGISEDTVLEYKDICRQVIDDKLDSLTQIPYLEGDFWPDCFENTIKLMEDEKTELQSFKKSTPKKKKSRSRKEADVALDRECETVMNSDPLSSRVMSLVRLHKDLFFVVMLRPLPSQFLPIIDPDPLTSPCIVDSRDTLLENARENLLEFSTIRRTVYSTLMLLKECAPGFGDRESFTCNHCGKEIDENVISYTCSKCVDFDLCDKCLLKNGHQHQMRSRGVDIEDEIPATAASRESQNEEPVLEHPTTMTLRRYAHAAQCEDVDCHHLYCHKAKAWIFHAKGCRRMMDGCNICNQLAMLTTMHASFCTIPMPLCKIGKCSEVKVATRFSLRQIDPVEKFKQHNANHSTASTFFKFRDFINSLKQDTMNITNNMF